jgi:ABC-type spermidine/putrescine transport system permease subunit II
MSETFLRRLYFFAVGLFLALPLIVVAGVSVNEKQDLTFPPVGFSLSWYAQIFADPEWRRALIASIVLALSAAAIAVSVALPLAWFLWRRIAGDQRPLRSALDGGDQPRHLFRHAAAGDAVARVCLDRSFAG